LVGRGNGRGACEERDAQGAARHEPAERGSQRGCPQRLEALDLRGVSDGPSLERLSRHRLVEFSRLQEFGVRYLQRPARGTIRTIARGEESTSSRDGKAGDRRAIERIVRRWGERAEVPGCVPHRFRQTYARMLFERGGDPGKIQHLLVHADISTTMLYTEVVADELAETAQLLEGRRMPARHTHNQGRGLVSARLR
jgi:integrase